MRRKLFICLALAILTLAIYWPVSHMGFILYDDWKYVYENPHVQNPSLENVWWTFTTFHVGNWHPLTWLSLMLDCKWFGLNASGHHWTNLGFHIANTLLLFGVLTEMTRALWRSAVVAALFAWHPMHIQSVAWISERKDVLSGFFMLLTLWAYIRFARAPARGDPNSRFRFAASGRYWLALFLFALGLMSKPMLVTVPLILLLLDFWPLGRISVADFRVPVPKGTVSLVRFSPNLKRLLWEKAPFLGLSLISCGLTLWAQQKARFIVSGQEYPWLWRIPDALVSYTAYLGKLFWPVHLAIFYPYQPLKTWEFVCMTLPPILLTIFFARKIRARPYLMVGWLWFLIMLVPVIGLVQVGTQSIADRYTYLPSIGLFTCVVWALGDVASISNVWRNGVILGLAAVLVGCLLDTKVQLGYWRNNLTLFRRCVEVSRENNYTGYWLLGNAYVQAGQLNDAVRSYRAALQMAPDSAEAQANLGSVLVQQKKFREAQQVYLTLRQLKPEDATIRKQLAYVSRMSEMQKKLSRLEEALKTQNTPMLHARIAGIRAGRDEFPEALKQYDEALALDPDSPGILNNTAWLLATCPDAAIRNGPRAVQLAKHACEITGYQQTLYIGTLAAAYAEAGRFDEAIAAAQKACSLATQQGETNLLQRNEELLNLYRAHKPFRPNRG